MKSSNPDCLTAAKIRACAKESILLAFIKLKKNLPPELLNIIMCYLGKPKIPVQSCDVDPEFVARGSFKKRQKYTGRNGRSSLRVKRGFLKSLGNYSR